jgi:hypothetical protein
MATSGVVGFIFKHLLNIHSTINPFKNKPARPTIEASHF